MRRSIVTPADRVSTRTTGGVDDHFLDLAGLALADVAGLRVVIRAIRERLWPVGDIERLVAAGAGPDYVTGGSARRLRADAP